jgi:hypothetical protein
MRMSAWHGPPSGHQQARSRPANSRRTSMTVYSSRPSASASRNFSTHCSRSPSMPMRYGLPHRVGRATTVTSVGFRQPLVLWRRTRFGMSSKYCPDSVLGQVCLCVWQLKITISPFLSRAIATALAARGRPLLPRSGTPHAVQLQGVLPLGTNGFEPLASSSPAETVP